MIMDPPHSYLDQLQADARVGLTYHWATTPPLHLLLTQLTGKKAEPFHGLQIHLDFNRHFTAALLGAETITLDHQQFTSATLAQASTDPRPVPPLWCEFRGLHVRSFEPFSGALLFAVPQGTTFFGVPLQNGVLFMVLLGGADKFTVGYHPMYGDTVTPGQLASPSALSVQQMVSRGHSRRKVARHHDDARQLLRAVLARVAGEDDTE
ncbi:hypothetical protein [Deinococcus marmoris]|uniref:Uncharacterized protein n=1 Tax=Deinococcus marmoris TaxID=249408 RepID=A0A1U7P0M4_9DEIO|nr:hypothetical protein [Deinococcus marmoris]OLV17225.1 hypothetical protein BOO71_0009289 [Deinococcus marmoris]OLV18714.1 hypothetical protein BOO71_0005182 [Deinococcus marmoris]